jgi:phosphoribosylglycinamide formyltransferase-1
MYKIRIAIFASGNGSNAIRVIEYFRTHKTIEVAVILSNKKNAGVLMRTKDESIEQMIIDNEQAKDGEFLSSMMQQQDIRFVVLSGYLRMIPASFIHTYPKQIINIHPSLLPKYGGSGMYGINVHKAVKEAGEKESGITIHLVNEEYDKGEIIGQHSIELKAEDSIEKIQQKVQSLEHKWFAQDIEKYIIQKNA